LADSFHEKTEAEIRRGVLQVAVLARLRGQAYGYDLIRVLNEAGLPVEEGTLYPVLRRL
jgi:DNA-binding PadR family transcriptional regulator